MATMTIPQNVIDATAKSLASTLSTLTKQELAKVAPIAGQWATQSAVWAAELASAKAANDTASVTKYTNDLALLASDSIIEAADYGINAQSVSEETLKALLNFATMYMAQFAATAVTAAL